MINFQKKINPKQQLKLLRIARKALISYLRERKIPKITINDKLLNCKCGVFVTLHKDGHLRGCIGEFVSKEPLYKAVQRMVIDAGINDPRFRPVDYGELKAINIEISVLSPCQKINGWRKIKLGEDGVLIKQGWRSGTYLPQVATETGWTKEELLAHLCADKAGLPPDSYKDPATEIFTYTTQSFKEGSKAC